MLPNTMINKLQLLGSVDRIHAEPAWPLSRKMEPILVARNSPYKTDFPIIWRTVADHLSSCSTQMALSTRTAILRMRHLTVPPFKHILVAKWVKHLVSSIQQGAYEWMRGYSFWLYIHFIFRWVCNTFLLQNLLGGNGSFITNKYWEKMYIC